MTSCTNEDGDGDDCCTLRGNLGLGIEREAMLALFCHATTDLAALLAAVEERDARIAELEAAEAWAPR